MDTTETVTGTPNKALLRSEFSATRGVLRGLSTHTNHAFVGLVALRSVDGSQSDRTTLHAAGAGLLEAGVSTQAQVLIGHPGLGTPQRSIAQDSIAKYSTAQSAITERPITQRSTHISVERLRSAFQHAHPRA